MYLHVLFYYVYAIYIYIYYSDLYYIVRAYGRRYNNNVVLTCISHHRLKYIKLNMCKIFNNAHKD